MLRLTKTLKKFCSIVPKQEVVKLDYYNLNPEEYKDLTTPIKADTSFAFVQVEPFPRMRLMKICQIILHTLKKIPDDQMIRLYYEEKTKWMME